MWSDGGVLIYGAQGKLRKEMVLFSSCPTKCQQLAGKHPPVSLLNWAGVGEEMSFDR